MTGKRKSSKSAKSEAGETAAVGVSDTPPCITEVPLYVVGIGASAGGLEALRSFFSSMPVDSGMAFVVIQHLAPDHKSLMVELLARATLIPVSRAEQGTLVESNRIYLIPPGFNMTIQGNRLQLMPPPGGKTLNLPIDIFFRSLAVECAERAIAVILSGTGSDGARGIRAVKEAGGMIMVQAEASAKFAGMPTSAIATGTADFVLPVEDMPGQLVNFSRHPFAARGAEMHTQIPEGSSHLERICARLREVTNIDFSHYKHATFARRIERRMNISQVQDIQEYIQCLVQSTREAEALGKDLLIGVTKFFRDSESFRVLSDCIRQRFEQTPEGQMLRIWSAACSTGEEAYTLAMLCEEIRSAYRPRVDFKVFATDIDKAALEIASAGIYPRSVVADLPRELLDRYFLQDGAENFRVIRSLRDRLIFAKQDLLSDPPFTKIDLICCRNLMIYLRPEAQRKLLSLFHFSLTPGGLLFLGSSETLGDLNYAFETIDSKHRIHRKAGGVSLRVSDTVHTSEEGGLWTSFVDDHGTRTRGRRHSTNSTDAIQQHMLRRFAPAALVMDTHFHLVYSNGPVSNYIQMPAGPVNLDVLKMVPRDLSLAISAALNQAQREGRTVEFRSISLPRGDGGKDVVKIHAEVFEPSPELGKLFLVALEPDIAPVVGVADFEQFNLDRQLLDRIATLEGELQSTRESLQSSIEQQETANEELQASNEELLAANEELQSTNEELESVNEELYTVNAEYQGKIFELTELNDDMLNFARSTDIGTIFFDKDLHIRRFTPVLGRLTGLTESDIGRNLATFADPALQLMLAAAPKVIKRGNGMHEEILDLGARGTFLLRLMPYRTNNKDVEGLVASLVDISKVYDAEQELKAILETVNTGICVTDEKGRFVQVNTAYCRIYGYSPHELIGKHFAMVLPPEDRAYGSQLHDRFIESGVEMPALWEVVDKHGEKHKIAVRASLLRRTDGSRRKITVVTDFADIVDLQAQSSLTARAGHPVVTEA